jgi:hypothetical protein
MKTKTLIAMVTAACGTLLLAGCMGGTIPVSAPTSCMVELSPPGTYIYDARDGTPDVRPSTGGTPEGAAALMDCIERKNAAAGMQETVTVETVGNQTTRTYTYGQPPATTTSSSSASTTTGGTCRNRNVLTGGSGYYGCTP